MRNVHRAEADERVKELIQRPSFDSLTRKEHAQLNQVAVPVTVEADFD